MMIPIAVVAVSAILLAVFLFKSAANWNWVQITFTALIFITAIFAGIGASQSMKTRVAWMKQDKSNREQLERQQIAFDLALYGPTDAIAYDTTSLRGINETLRVDQAGQGRSWAASAVEAQGAQIVATFPPDDGTATAPQIRQDMTLFAFSVDTASVAEQQVTVPVNFLGSFIAQNSAGDQVTFDPVFVTAGATTEVQQPSTAWTFFERMPGDSRDTFKRDMGMDESNFNLTQYREALRTKYLPADRLGYDPNNLDPQASFGAAAYERLLDSFSFDGLPLNVIDTWIRQEPNRLVQVFDPPPSDRVLKLSLNAPLEFTVDSTGALFNEGPFNTVGQAVDPALHFGGPVKFNRGDEILVDKVSAEGFMGPGNVRQQGLLETADVSIVDEFYVRPMRDYPILLKTLGDRLEKTSEAKARVDANIDATNQIVDSSNAQVSTRDEIIAKLRDDRGRFTQDLETIDVLLQSREQQYQELQQTIRTTYNQILKLYEENERRRSASDTGSEVSDSLARK